MAWDSTEITTDYAEEKGVLDTDVVSQICFVFDLSSDAIERIGLAVGDTITINAKDPYMYEYELSTQTVSTTVGEDDEGNLSIYLEKEVPMDTLGIIRGETTFAQLKEMYTGFTYDYFSVTSSIPEGITDDDIIISPVIFCGTTATSWDKYIMAWDSKEVTTAYVEEKGVLDSTDKSCKML